MSTPFQILYYCDDHGRYVHFLFDQETQEENYEVSIINSMGEVLYRTRIAQKNKIIDISHLLEEDLHIKVHAQYITFVKHLSTCLEKP